MIYDRRFWFAPPYVIVKANEALQRASTLSSAKRNELEKAAKEARAAAIFLVGLTDLTGNPFRMQLVDPKDGAPDIRSMVLTESTRSQPDMEYQDLEVVTLDHHSDEALDEFILRTKLSKKKAYQPDTMVLCFIDKTISGARPWKYVADALAHSDKDLSVYVAGRVEPVDLVYAMARVFPNFDSVRKFNLEDASRAQRMTGTEFLERGRRRTSPRLPRGDHPPPGV